MNQKPRLSIQCHPRDAGKHAAKQLRIRGLIDLIHQSHESDRSKARLRRKSKVIFRALSEAKILEIKANETRAGRTVSIAAELQDDFSIHHSLSLFLIHAVGRLNPSDDSFHMKALSFTEAVLEDPRIVLLKQQDRLRRDAYASMKAEGVDYDERQDRLEKITWPMPDSDLIFESFDDYVASRPWLAKAELRPKAVARDMYEKYASFNDYVNEFGLEQSEGVLLRYLSQAYKTVIQNIPTLLWDDAFMM